MARYRMLGRDADCNPTQYRTWGSDTPDFEAQNYTGLKSGPNPLANVLAYDITDVPEADFKLPNPLDWTDTQHVLPTTLESSALSFQDGYAYLFGGINSSRILRANLARPAEWEDTGAELPATISNSHLGVIGNNIYLFGGVVNGTISNSIYSAPISDPLVWNDTGATLPDAIADGQLLISGSTNVVIIIGGRNNTQTKDNVYSASLDNPLSWSEVAGFNMPLGGVYKSTSTIVDGYVYMFGGLFSHNNPSNYVFSLQIGSPEPWQATGTLPFPSAGGQFVPVGDKGYLITPGKIPSSQRSFGTRIYQCHLSDPNTWIDTRISVPGEVSHSQLGIIDDRLYLFGGNGNSVIFNDNPYVTYDPHSDTAIAYGENRAAVKNTTNPNDVFEIIGFPPWKIAY